MNTSQFQFMDKQIMDLSSCSPPPSIDFIDVNNNTDDHQKQRNEFGSNKEEMVPSYDFHPIRSNTAFGLSHAALDLAGSTPSRGFTSLDSVETSNLVTDKTHNTTIMSEIDRTMKKYADNLLHVMDGVSARLTQLETRTHNLQDLVDALKVSVDNTHGSSDGKIRQLKNILLEVQSNVQLLKDKQDIVEAQLSKLQVSKADQHPKVHSLHSDPTAPPPTPVSMEQMPRFNVASFPLPPSSAAAPSQKILQPPSSQLLAKMPNQFSPQQEPYYSTPNHSQPPLPNQSPSQTQTLQPPHQPPYQSPPQQPPPPSGYNPEEQLPFPMQSYPPNLSHLPPPTGSPPSQQFYSTPQPQSSMYDGAGGRSNSGFPSGYSSESYPYTGTPMASGKPLHMSSSGTGYPQLSNTRPLPHALPMAPAISSSGGASSPRSEGRVPIDDVIDRVTTMGFSRDQVRATVRKLTENGQAVDLNVVLDKLMNGGGP